MIFYDFEVFKYDWLVVFIDVKSKERVICVNDEDKLNEYYNEHKDDIWIGFNSRHYDQYIFKGILCGFDPKKINDWIIKKDKPGWKFSSLFREIPLNNYDVMYNTDRGLKTFEGYMGNNIKETSVPFDIDRKLTQEEIDETIKYCIHDVENTIEIFIHRKDDFEAQMNLLKMFNMPLSYISKTKVQLTSIILDAHRRQYDDEFDIDFPNTLKIEKYKHVIDFYKNPENLTYFKKNKRGVLEKTQLEVMVAGVPTVFGYGGVHGALEKYYGEGYFVNMDVTSLYPSLMIRYDLLSRSCNPEKFKYIVEKRVEFKKAKNPLQLPLKNSINGTYGAMKDKNNDLYDPRQANRVCIYGQLLLLDLMEHLEAHCQIIQSNTDGILVKLNRYEDFDLIDDIAYEWEKRTGLNLEFDEYTKVFQKDVNNYIFVDREGHFKTKGAYVKKLNDMDYDMSIVNRALVEYMVNGIPVETTINKCDHLKEFQHVVKVSNKYKYAMYGCTFRKERSKKIWNNDGEILNDRTFRVFASRKSSDKGLFKYKEGKNPEKFAMTSEHSFVVNEDVNNLKVPNYLDKQWYIDLAKERLKQFGVI